MRLDWVDDIMTLRAIIALGRLTADQEDLLAWWGLTEGLTGMGPTFSDYAYNHRTVGEGWGHALLRQRGEEIPGLPVSLVSEAKVTVDAVVEKRSRIDEGLAAWLADNEGRPWSDWILTEGANDCWRTSLTGEKLSSEVEKLLTMVGSAVESDAGLHGFLDQLEAIGEDLATEEVGGIRLMTMSKARGLTVDAAIMIGVEEGLVPLGGADEEEERRLLYVAMTRAQKVCLLTCVSCRTGQLARSGGGRTQGQRRRSPLIENVSYGCPLGGQTRMDRLSEIEKI